jgi:hypothetical protein
MPPKLCVVELRRDGMNTISISAANDRNTKKELAGKHIKERLRSARYKSRGITSCSSGFLKRAIFSSAFQKPLNRDVRPNYQLHGIREDVNLL